MNPLPFGHTNRTGGIAAKLEAAQACLARIADTSTDLVARADAAAELGREGR